MKEDMKNWTPEIGDYVKPDLWVIGELLMETDDFKDHSFPGCQFRIRTIYTDLAVNVTVTSRGIRKFQGSWGWVRVKIEFVGDGEPSEFTGGWMKKARK